MTRVRTAIEGLQQKFLPSAESLPSISKNDATNKHKENGVVFSEAITEKINKGHWPAFMVGALTLALWPWIFGGTYENSVYFLLFSGFVALFGFPAHVVLKKNGTVFAFIFLLLNFANLIIQSHSPSGVSYSKALLAQTVSQNIDSKMFPHSSVREDVLVKSKTKELRRKNKDFFASFKGVGTNAQEVLLTASSARSLGMTDLAEK